jgi:hypothetical protein
MQRLAAKSLTTAVRVRRSCARNDRLTCMQAGLPNLASSCIKSLGATVPAAFTVIEHHCSYRHTHLRSCPRQDAL